MEGFERHPVTAKDVGINILAVFALLLTWIPGILFGLILLPFGFGTNICGKITRT